MIRDMSYIVLALPNVDSLSSIFKVKTINSRLIKAMLIVRRLHSPFKLGKKFQAVHSGGGYSVTYSKSQ